MGVYPCRLVLNRDFSVAVPFALISTLILVSVLVLSVPWRYGPADAETLSSSPDGAVWLQAARFAAAVRVAEEAGRTVLTLPSSVEEGAQSLALYYLPELPVEGAVRVAVEAMSDGLQPGERDWEYAQVALWSLDRQGRPLWYWPKRILSVEGDEPWAWHEATIPLGDEVGRMILLAYNGAAAGDLALRGLRLQTIVERPVFTLLRWTLMACWALALLWLAWKLARAPGRVYGKVLLFGALTVALAGILTPQPYFSQATKPLERALITLLVAIDPPQEMAADPSQATETTDDERATASQPVANSEAGATSSAEPAERQGPGLTPRQETHQDYPITFKQFGHYLCFAGLAFAAWLAFPQTPLRALALYLALGLLSTEVLQLFLTTRSSNWQDVLVDIVGVASGLLLAALLSATPLARRLTLRSKAPPPYTNLH